MVAGSDREVDSRFLKWLIQLAVVICEPRCCLFIPGIAWNYISCYHSDIGLLELKYIVYVSLGAYVICIIFAEVDVGELDDFEFAITIEL